MSNIKRTSTLILISQYLFISILLSIPWIFSLDYSILYNLGTLLIFLPFMKFLSRPRLKKIVNNVGEEEELFIDIKRKYLGSWNKREIAFYKWYLIWVPVFKRDYTFTHGENFNDIIYECYNDYRLNRKIRNKSLEIKVKRFKESDHKIM